MVCHYHYRPAVILLTQNKMQGPSRQQGTRPPPKRQAGFLFQRPTSKTSKYLTEYLDYTASKKVGFFQDITISVQTTAASITENWDRMVQDMKQQQFPSSLGRLRHPVQGKPFLTLYVRLGTSTWDAALAEKTLEWLKRDVGLHMLSASIAAGESHERTFYGKVNFDFPLSQIRNFTPRVFHNKPKESSESKTFGAGSSAREQGTWPETESSSKEYFLVFTQDSVNPDSKEMNIGGIAEVPTMEGDEDLLTQAPVELKLARTWKFTSPTAHHDIEPEILSKENLVITEYRVPLNDEVIDACRKRKQEETNDETANSKTGEATPFDPMRYIRMEDLDKQFPKAPETEVFSYLEALGLEAADDNAALTCTKVLQNPNDDATSSEDIFCACLLGKQSVIMGSELHRCFPGSSGVGIAIDWHTFRKSVYATTEALRGARSHGPMFQWGHDHEPKARNGHLAFLKEDFPAGTEWYWFTPGKLLSCAATPPQRELMNRSSSPDGILVYRLPEDTTYRARMVEIKCPRNSWREDRLHPYRRNINNTPPQYMAQILDQAYQWNALADHPWCQRLIREVLRLPQDAQLQLKASECDFVVWTPKCMHVTRHALTESAMQHVVQAYHRYWRYELFPRLLHAKFFPPRPDDLPARFFTVIDASTKAYRENLHVKSPNVHVVRGVPVRSVPRPSTENTIDHGSFMDDDDAGHVTSFLDDMMDDEGPQASQAATSRPDPTTNQPSKRRAIEGAL